MNTPFLYGTSEVTEESFNFGLRQMINTNSPMLFQNDTEALAFGDNFLSWG